MNLNATFTMTHFLKLCYNVFILENKIDALVFGKNCINLYYVTLGLKICMIVIDIIKLLQIFEVIINKIYINYKIY
jgi:hypothetical protein